MADYPFKKQRKKPSFLWFLGLIVILGFIFAGTSAYLTRNRIAGKYVPQHFRARQLAKQPVKGSAKRTARGYQVEY